MREFIRGFNGEYRFLSNFVRSEIFVSGVWYPTVEHAFQALKFEDEGYQDQIANVDPDKPGLAKRMGRSRDYPLRAGWDDGVAAEVMAECIAAKFTDPVLRAKLLATGDAVLVETNNWGDDIWGDSTNTKKPGRNQLGIILMAVRSAIRAEESSRD